MSRVLAPVESGAIVILGGRVSAQIERHDVAMDATVWSASATIDVPEVVRQALEGQVTAGAGVITANACAPCARSRRVGHSSLSQPPPGRSTCTSGARSGRCRGAAGEARFAGSMSSMVPLRMQQRNGMVDDDCDEATVPYACRDGPGFAFAEIGTFASLHWFFSEVASQAPNLKHARSRGATRHAPIVEEYCGSGPGQFRVPRDGLETETGLTADGKHA